MKRLLVIPILLICIILSAQDSVEWTPKSAKKWIEKKSWTNGWTIAPHKSVNAINFATQYHKNKEIWNAVFLYLANHNLEQLSLGKHIIVTDRCWITVSEYIPNNAQKGAIESHRRFIDMQYVLKGDEKMGLAQEAQVRQTYNLQKDVAFYSASKIKYYFTNPSCFFLFFPTDIHQPSIRGKGKLVSSRKIVAKIEYKE